MHWHCWLQVRLWAASGAFALGIKIFQGHQPRLTLLMVQPANQHVDQQEFGHGSGCTGPNQMLVRIPVAAIFRGSPLPAALVPAAEQPPHHIVLDLFKLKELIHLTVQQW